MRANHRHLQKSRRFLAPSLQRSDAPPHLFEIRNAPRPQPAVDLRQLLAQPRHLTLKHRPLLGRMRLTATERILLRPVLLLSQFTLKVPQVRLRCAHKVSRMPLTQKGDVLFAHHRAVHHPRPLGLPKQADLRVWAGLNGPPRHLRGFGIGVTGTARRSPTEELAAPTCIGGRCLKWWTRAPTTNARHNPSSSTISSRVRFTERTNATGGTPGKQAET